MTEYKPDNEKGNEGEGGTNKLPDPSNLGEFSSGRDTVWRESTDSLLTGGEYLPSTKSVIRTSYGYCYILFDYTFEYDLSPTETLLLGIIGSFHDTKKWMWHSQSSLSVRCRVGVDTVRKALLKLEAKGLIEKSDKRSHRGTVQWKLSAEGKRVRLIYKERIEKAKKSGGRT